MASRKAKQFERKYSSYRKLTATEDVNYRTHSSRSAYRTESHVERSDRRGRSSSSEIVAGSETRSLPVFIAIQDYQPDELAADEIALEQGQIVEVLDCKNPTRWLVRTKARPPQCGWVPGSYFEAPTEYYAQRRKTRQIDGAANLSEEQEALLRRDQVYEDLLRSEEQFVSLLHSAVDDFVKIMDDAGLPESIKQMREKIVINIPELYNFHANVMLKGLQYYSDDPGKAGQTFIRLEKDFDHYVQFYRQLPETLQLLQQTELKQYLQELADKSGASLSYAEYLEAIADRMKQYQAFFKEFVKYSSRARQNARSMQKALELTLALPQRAGDLELLRGLRDFHADPTSLGRLVRHDLFKMYDGQSAESHERYALLFPTKILLTERSKEGEETVYKHLSTIRLGKYRVSAHRVEDDCLVFHPKEPGLPYFMLRPANLATSDVTYKAWMREIADLQSQLKSAILAESIDRLHGHFWQLGTPELAETMVLRTLFIIELRDAEEGGLELVDPAWCPEEGPPRKKIKSPPAISPTGSSTSIYSGGSSSIDWTTTGTTLEMQGTRVTRTQYGFRTLQESSAKMCLKVTGYPLPLITWYKDDVLLNEDSRHTFYADDDGFFAMTIDPVQVSDTGRYTCMATNEYGQASTSAFFRVLKVEKEAAPPKFVQNLADQTCNEGEVISFECDVEGWPEPELQWLVDDQPLRPSHDFRLEYDGQKAKLEIRDAQPDDTGLYSVRIQNEYGTAQSTASLKVEADPDKNHVAPEFQAKVEDVECDEGAEVRFKAVITGDPTPEMIWQINGIPLTASDKVKLISEDGICICIIKDVTRHFDGIVSCTGKNRLGSTTCDGRLRVRVPPAPPSFVKPLENRMIREKGAVSFEVDINGFPDPAVIFTLKGKELKNGEGGVEIIGDDGLFKVTVSECTAELHEGEIVCRAVNEHGTAESRARLMIEPPDEESRSAPTFIKDIDDQTVREGEEAVFETAVQGSPTPSVSWFINGQAVDEKTKGIKMSSSGHHHRIVIDSAEYAGTVMCRAENAVGRFETRAKLTVIAAEKPKRPPRFTEELADGHAIHDGQVVFEVRVEAEPTATLSWTLNGVPLIHGQFVKIREFDGSCKLELLNLQLDQAGTLECRAKNSEGEAATQCRLSVAGKPTPPEFDQKPKSITATRGSEAVFEAHATGEPTPSYQWSIDGRKVKESTEGARIEVVNRVSSLVVDTSIHSSSATISVIAENNLGLDESGARLTVQELPRISRPLQDTTTTRGEMANFECTVEHAVQAQWFVVYKPVTEGQPGVRISQDDKGEFRLSLDSSLFSGKVTIKATNATGATADSSANLTVNDPRKPPEISQKPKDLKIDEGKPIEIDVVALEAESFEWKLNETQLKDGENGVKITREGDMGSLRIEEAKPSHSGTLTVTATNEAGKIENSVQIDIKPKGVAPKVEGLQNVSITEKEDANFKVRITADPAATVRWSINEKAAEEYECVNCWKSGEEYFMKITRVTAKEQGTVKVSAENICGSDSQSAQLEVKKKIEKPIFEATLTDKTTEADEPLSWNVKLSNPDGETSVKWYLNGNELKPSDAIQIVDAGDGTHRLTIAEAKPEMSGKLVVRADNPAGQLEIAASLTVKPKIHKPEFEGILSDKSVEAGEPLSWDVKLKSADDSTNVKWNLNGIEVKPSEGVKIEDAGDGSHKLKIDESKPEMTGILTVKAENPLGTAELKAAVNVLPKIQKPEFDGNLKDGNVEAGNPVSWEIKLKNPDNATTVKWYLNGNELKPGDSVQITDAGEGKFKLSIGDAKPDMSGTFTVKAENPLGATELSASLNVKSKNQKPEFTQKPQNHEVVVDESVKFSAVVAGVPVPTVKWYLNGKELIHSEEIKVKYDSSTGKTSIRIYKPALQHSGTVKVTAENSAGSVEATAQLVVDKPKEVPKFTSNMDDRQVAEGDSVRFATNVEAYPPAEVEWTINGEPVSKFDNVKVSTEGEKTHVIEISEIRPEQSGELSCQATNSVGFKKQNATLQVKKTGDAPTFAKNLEDRLVEEGEVVEMTARLNKVRPPAKVTWLKDNREIKSSDQLELKELPDGELSLRIPSARPEDKCRITIRAENAFGSAECSSSIGVTKRRPQSKPAFQSDIAPISLQEGDSLHCKLLVTGDPAPFTKWYVNGQLVCETEDTELKQENGVYSMTIHGVTTDMTGTIKCTVYNKMGEATTEGPLKVFAPIPVEFETALCDATCREGDTLKLKAVLLGEPTPDVSWFINGKKLQESQNIKIHAEKGTYTVTIKDITCDYSGKVVCEAVNEFGKASSEAMLLVLPRGEPPDFLEWLSNVRARESSKVVHRVVFTGDPRPILTWFINNQEVKNSDDISIVTEGNTSILTIKNFVPEKHVGEIICKAENDAGEVSCTANMAAYTSDMFSESESDAQADDAGMDGASELSERESLPEEIQRTPTPVMAPKFITKLKDTKAKKGHEAIFECVVPDTKGVCCKWLKDGRELELIARIRVQTRTLPEGQIAHQLVIEDIRPEDAGKYTCIVENTAGRDTCEATLNIIEALEKLPKKAPEFLVKLADQKCSLSEKIVLECKVVGVPEPEVKWYYEKQQLVASERVTIEKVGDVQRLVVQKMEKRDEGVYKCIAENEAGSSETQAKLLVDANAPTFTKSLSNQTASVSEKATFTCSVKGTPQPHVEFFSGSTRLITSSEYAVEHDATNTHWRLVIHSTSSSHFSSSIRAVATNTAGSATSEAQLYQTKAAPKMDQGLKKQVVKKGDRLEMSVKVSGGKPDVVKWSKDGVPIVPNEKVKLKERPDGTYALVIDGVEAKDEGEYAVEVSNAFGKDQSKAPVEVQEADLAHKGDSAPRFTKELVEVKVAENDKVVQSVTVEGVPEPRVEWLKDGTPINVDGSHFITKQPAKGEHLIEIKNARQSDSGTYSAKAVNTAGTATTQANFAIEKHIKAPEFLEGLRPIEVKESETANISVVVTGVPEPKIEWYKDNRPIEIDGVHIIRNDEEGTGKHTILIKNASSSDAGSITAKATNPAGEAKSEAKFAVSEDINAPHFKEPLPLATEVKEGDVATLSVVVEGKPEPEVKWLLDGREIKVDGNHVKEVKDDRGKHQLIIQQVKAEDIGKYSCVAVNKAGKDTSVGDLKTPKYSYEKVGAEDVAPFFVEPLNEAVVTEGETVVLRCKVNEESKPEIKWFKDGKEVTALPGKLVVEKGVITLTINSASKADIGSYRCEAVNKAGKAQTEAPLLLKFAQQVTMAGESGDGLGFAKLLDDQKVKQGERVRFHCIVSGFDESRVKVTWTKDGGKVPAEAKIASQSDGTQTLVIEEVLGQHIGDYRCTVVDSSDGSSIWSEAALLLIGGAVEPTEETAKQGPPEFIQLLRSCTVSIGEKAELKCRVKGEPRPTITWSKQGKTLVQSKRFQTEFAADGTVTLFIKNVTHEDAGEYRCYAENSHGSAWTEGPIIVIAEGAPKPAAGAPDFIEPVRPATVYVGETAVLEGRISGDPRPRVKWFKNSVEVKPSDKHQIEDLPDGTQRLTIKNALLTDADEFRCSASNKHGDVSCDVTLIVREKEVSEEPVAPTFVRTLVEIRSTEREKIVFECQVSGFPVPVLRWYKDKKQIAKDDVYFVQSTEGKEIFRLTINSAEFKDAGEYRAEAINVAGTARSDACLKVSKQGDEESAAPQFAKELSPVQVKDGEKAVLECKVNGVPLPQVKWFKDGEEIKAGPEITIESSLDGTNRLIINKAKLSDQGNYRAEATNNAGSMSSKAPLSVTAGDKDALRLLKGLEDKTVQRSSRLLLSVQVEGKVKTVKWYKGTEQLTTNSITKIEKVSEMEYKLEVTDSEMTDAGSYRVVLANDIDTIESNCQVTVTEGGEDKLPSFKKGLNDTSLPKGTPLVLEVEIEGNPKTVKWFKDGREVSPGRRAKIEDLGDGRFRLTIPDFEESDVGTYSVKAKNDAGAIESKSKVTIGEPIGKGLGAPKIVQGLVPTTVNRGETATLRVKTDGPVRQVKWYKNGKEITDGKPKDLGNGEYALEIPNAQENDAADYSVKVSNDDGTADSSAALTVRLPGKGDGGPKIVEGLVPTTVNKGETATVRVKTEGPVKQVKWYKNGKEILGAKTKDLGNGEYALEIPNAQEEDAADYSVAVSNEEGTADSSAALTVKLPGKGDGGPKIVEGLVPTTVNKGETATLRVKTEGPVKQVKWYKNGREIPDAKARDLGNGEYILEIPNAQDVDAADYSVKVSNDDGSADSSASLTVKLPGGAKLEIVEGLVPTSVSQGETAVFRVKTTGSVKIVKWYKNGKEIANPQSKEIGDGAYQLEIPDATGDDSADYKVVVSNDDGEADSSAALTVKLPAAKPKIVEGLVPTTVDQGETATFRIKTEGTVKDVKWYKNGTEMKRPTSRAAGNGIYELLFPDADKDDEAEYKVVVSNEAGEADSSASLTVKKAKPSFLKPLQDNSVAEGEEVVFDCESSVVADNVKWFISGKEVKTDSRVSVTQKEKKHVLVIKRASKEDQGEIKIELSNSSGTVDSSAALTVKKVAVAPKILKGLEDLVVAKDAEILLQVKVEGEPSEIRWLKEGVALSVSDSIKMDKIDEQTYQLRIPSAQLSDASRYSFSAKNEAGSANTAGNVEVDEKPKIVKGLQDEEVNEDEEAFFKVEVSAPVRSVKWYRNGQEIKPDSRVKAKQGSPKKAELLFKKSLIDDCAEYKVVLSNAAGECDSSASLVVKKRPERLKIIDGLRDADVVEGQPIALSAKVQGVPKTVKWYKNGQEITPSDKIKIGGDPATGVYSLEIPSSTKPDGAAYGVTFGNESGEVTSGCVVLVKTPKAKDENAGAHLLSPLKDTEVEEGDVLTLTCKAGGEPFPDIKWEKDGVELGKNDRISMRTALDGTVTLRIRDSKKSDVGTYRVIATNESGTDSSQAQVTVRSAGEQPSKPKFVIVLRSSSSSIGSRKEFAVKVRGFPKPALTWFLNGKPLATDGRVHVDDMADGNYILTINEVHEDDYGTLRCVARNELGEDECQAEFDRIDEETGRDKGDDRYPPRFNVPLWDRCIPEGDLLSIECHVDAKPPAVITWFKNGEEVEEKESLEVFNTTDGACRLRIVKMTKDDIGVYKCFAKNELGSADTRANYNVEVTEVEEKVEKKEYAPRFNPPLDDQNVFASQKIHLFCKIDAIPRAGVSWYKDGLPLRADATHCIEYAEDGTASLSISDASQDDIGAYRCVASNSLGSTNCSCNVGVKVPKVEVKKEGEEPFFTKSLVDCWADRGHTISMHCEVTGDPFPEIKWYRNGTLVRAGPQIEIETTSAGICSLTVKECSLSDEGMYRCEAENKHGKAKTQAVAHVEIGASKTELKTNEGEPPRFIIPLEDTTVMPDSPLEIQCKVAGTPTPQVKWSKDGTILIDDYRYEVTSDLSSGVHTLRVKEAALQDEGTYRCVATNSSGSATSKASVTIDDGRLTMPKSDASPPRITIRLSRDTRATEGQPLKLECKVDGFPLPEVTWHKDGAQLTPTDRLQISLAPDGTARLIIPQCCADDEGLYRVIATNPSGTASDKGNAIVKMLPKDRARSAEKDAFDANKAPRLIEPLENIRIPEKQRLILRCKFSGEPKPTIKWFKNGERVFPYDRLQLKETPDGWCELIVDSTSRQDDGGYRCVAENEHGSARTTGDVSVIGGARKPAADVKEGKAPGFTIPLTIKRAKPGETVVFECVPFGNPFPAIKWLKDGIELTADTSIKVEEGPDNTQRLILSEVSFLSEGYYRCVATNQHGTASTKAELNIDGDRMATLGAPVSADENKEPEECKPRIRRGLHNMSIHQGSVVEMVVCATGNPTPTVKWFKDGKEIQSEGPDGKRTIFTDERGIHRLIIVNADPDDEGEYALEATNKLGSARTEGLLSIIKPRGSELLGPDDRHGMPYPPGFIRQLKNKHVFNKMPTIFDCLVVGHPPPDVEWLHNGKKIVPGGRIKIQRCGGGSHALIILDTTVDDAGEYVAVAKNSAGTASSSAILDVTVPYLDTIKFDSEIDVTPYLTEEYGFKKINYASLPTPPDRGPFIKEVTGHYLTLSWIPTKRAPPRYPQVTYVIEIRELPYKEWTLLDYNIPEPVCKVRNLELGKSYQFRVRAENIYGISDPSPSSPPSRLMAPPQPVMDKNKKIIPLLNPYAERAISLAHAEQYACAPWFAPGVNEKRFCAENETLTIILNLSGYPDPEITWKFRGIDIETKAPLSKCRVYNYGGNETTLSIQHFNRDDIGQYQCIARNQYGEATQIIYVDISTRPAFLQGLEDKVFPAPQPLKLDVRLEGTPFPELKWMKDWRPLVESSRVKFIKDGPFLCSLLIMDPLWRDSGIYSCVAMNDAGQATTSCTVTVEADERECDAVVALKKKQREKRQAKQQNGNGLANGHAQKMAEIYEEDEEEVLPK